MIVSHSSTSVPLRSWRDSAAGRGDLARLISVRPEGNCLYQGREHPKTRQPDGKGFYSDATVTCYGNWISGSVIDGFVQKFFSPESEETYVGKWTLDGASGIGALVLSPKRCYIGEWDNGKREGLGVLEATRLKFIGTFHNDEIDQGFIEMRVTDTASYIGEWAQKQPHGLGAWVDAKDRSTLIGRWILGEFTSGVVENMPYLHQGIYTGEWEGGIPQGKGFWQIPGVVSYQGEWDKGQFHGQGHLKLPCGSYKKGLFDGHRCVSGMARIKDVDDTIYEGEWKGDRFEGHAVVTIPDMAPVAGTFLADGSWVEQPSCDVSLERCELSSAASGSS